MTYALIQLEKSSILNNSGIVIGFDCPRFLKANMLFDCLVYSKIADSAADDTFANERKGCGEKKHIH